MKAKRFQGTAARQVLAAMITDPLVCARIAAKWPDEGLFDSNWANQIGWWCVKYHRRYNAPPDRKIKNIFESWASKPRDDETVAAIERVLVSTSNENRDSTDSEFLLDLSEEYFNEVRVRKLLDKAKLGLDNGQIDHGIESIEAFNRISLRSDVEYLEPGTDLEHWTRALEEETMRPIVRFLGGAAARFFEGAFCRGEFYAFMAPDKTGKTTYLIDLAYRALRCRNNVAYFEVGDGDENEVLRRLGCRLVGKPVFGKTCVMPIKWDDDSNLEVEDQFMEGLSDVEAFRAVRKISKNMEAFRLSPHPNSSISVDGIARTVRSWKDDDGWIPSVIVIDYADILAPPEGYQNTNDEIDETWKRLRRLSQELNCLVVTATQSNAGAYKKEDSLLSKSNFSGRKTKLAHVNGMIGINVSESERSTQQARLNWVVRRKTPNRKAPRFIKVAGCYDLENPLVLSR